MDDRNLRLVNNFVQLDIDKLIRLIEKQNICLNPSILLPDKVMRMPFSRKIAVSRSACLRHSYWFVLIRTNSRTVVLQSQCSRSVVVLHSYCIRIDSYGMRTAYVRHSRGALSSPRLTAMHHKLCVFYQSYSVAYLSRVGETFYIRMQLPCREGSAIRKEEYTTNRAPLMSNLL